MFRMVESRLPQDVSLRMTSLLRAALVASLLIPISVAGAQELEFADEAEAAIGKLHEQAADESCDVCAPESAHFGQWESIVDEHHSDMHLSHDELLPFDWFRHFGFRHSSSHGRHVGRGIPLEGTSWLNRPYHCDLFLGPLLGDELIDNRVSQTNVLVGGLRLGWDFDYYWGVEWRYGWANPNADFSTEDTQPNDVDFMISDVDLIYYPWGDSKVRPYFLTGVGVTRLKFVNDQDLSLNTSLLTIPFGGGIRFRQHPWLAWRLEILDNLAIGDDRISTMHNVSLTASMEMRFGARPATYWPWRTSKKVW